jgi:hypothetical protein
VKKKKHGLTIYVYVLLVFYNDTIESWMLSKKFLKMFFGGFAIERSKEKLPFCVAPANKRDNLGAEPTVLIIENDDHQPIP